MKKIYLLFILLYVAGLNNSTAQGTWTRKADFGGTARQVAAGFSINGKGYIGLGQQYSSQTFYKDFWEYDPVTNAWTQKADFNGAVRVNACGFSINGKGYIGMGQHQTSYKDFWEYDPVANVWTRKADFGGGARYNAASFSISGKGYIGTGMYKEGGTDHFLKDLWEYDPANNAWVQKADFGGGDRAEAVGFSIGNKGYFGTGIYIDVDPGTKYKDFWEYDPQINSWTQKADYGGEARGSATGFSLAGKGYIGTGLLSGGDFTKDFWEYDPTFNKWTQKADFGQATCQAVGFSIGAKGYIGTGLSNPYPYTANKVFWEYTPDCYQNITVYADTDGDGYGNVNKSKINPTCDILTGYVLDSTDCNDRNANIHPSAREVCNGIDDNCNGVIDDISGLKTTNITATTATFNWKKLPGAGLYLIKYRRIDPSVTTWSKTGAAASAIGVIISGLRPNSNYEWMIRSDCGGLNAAFSGPVKFKTAAALAAGQQEQSIKLTGTGLMVYPNPGDGNITVSLVLPKPQAVSISVVDVTGKEVYASNEGIVSGVYTRQLDLSKLNPGTYFLKLIHDGKSELKKIVVEK